jgi:hypothetical protein
MGMVMKKTARNDITGDFIASKPNSEMFEKNWDLIFRKKKPKYELDDGQLTEEQYAKIKELAEYELNKSTGEVQKVDHGDTTNTQK